MKHKERAQSELSQADLENLYVQQFPFVWRSLRRMGVPAEFAETAAQDVFLLARRSFEDARSHASAASWLFSLTMVISRNYRRSAFRRRLRAARGGALACGHRPTETQLMLFKLLDQLDEQRRAVYVLGELEGMPLDEISSAVALRPEEVQSRLAAARNTVLKAARRYVPDEETPRHGVLQHG